MTINDMLTELLDAGHMRAEASGFLADELRTALPGEAHGIAWSRIEGMLLGLAIGDSLGNRSESMLPRERRQAYGEIRDYLPNPYAGGQCVGLPSDDTQMAFFALEERLRSPGFDPAALARRFANETIFGMGSSVRAFVRNHRAGIPWQQAGTDSAGNGALMRIASVLVPHAGTPSPDLWAEAAVNTMLTHNCPASVGTSVAWVAILADLLSMPVPPKPSWWLERFVGVCRGVEGDVPLSARGGAWRHRREPLAAYTEHVVTDARMRGLPVLQACNGWYSGAFLMETVPSVLFILERHGHDPEEAIVRAVNDTKDNDTVGAIVGAAIGALHGVERLPARWRTGLLGRLGAGDDGRVQGLITEARDRWFGHAADH